MKTSIHSSPRSAPLPLLLLLLAALLLLTAAVHAVDEPKVGGLTKIKHVESNEEVQELGRFSVGEYNNRLRGRDAKPLAFVKVVEGQQQVVEGMQYYLKIAVAAPTAPQDLRCRRLGQALAQISPAHVLHSLH
uniref:Cystatin domain-containing protein n=1 Tax=Ananas comosus var. bracteatus TaxID=296719 RepID=A0A6V7NP15_ANACO|nr:unnamed protein product [Ananas comosus var. bracteatus]